MLPVESTDFCNGNLNCQSWGLTANINAPTLCFNDDQCYWRMARWEKYALQMLVDARRPQVAIEVGTCSGGSLQLLATKAKKVYSVDIDPGCSRKLATRHANVEFVIGDSRVVLPDLIGKLHRQQEQLGFVLIDGDHTTEGVAADIRPLLRYQPIGDLVVVIHDSFNPGCRQGILAADWHACPYVHYVEIDFVPGAFHAKLFDAAEPQSMWGGFAVAQLRATARTGNLVVSESQRATFDIIHSHSCYAANNRIRYVEG